MRTKIVVLTICVAWAACTTTPTQDFPEGILSQDQMIEVITDIQLINAAQKNIPIAGNKMKAMQDTSYAIIFSHHGTDYATFDSSLRTYSRQPEVMGAIMEQVAEQINSKK